MRQRSRYKSHLMVPVVGVTYHPVNPPVVTQYGTYVANRVYEGMSDALTKNYRSNVGRRSLPQNPLSYSCQSDVGEIGALKIPGSDATRFTLVSGPLVPWMNGAGVFGSPGAPSIPSYNLVAMTEAAKAACLARFDRPNYSFGEPIAELKHVVQTVKSPLETVLKLLKRFHKKRSTRVDHYLAGTKALGDLWASYSFGIGPLIGSADDAVDAYINKNMVRPVFETCYGSSRIKLNAELRVSASTPYAGWVSTRKGGRNFEAVVKAGIYYSVIDSDTRATMLGLRARDLPGVAWELVPLSFMVDRVINIKRFLNASFSLASNSVKIQGGYVTSRVNNKVTSQHTDIRAGTNPSRKWSPSDSKVFESGTFTYSRTSWNPTVADAVPRFENRLVKDIHSTLDLASIILGKLKIRL